MTKTLKKYTAKFFLIFRFLSKSAIYLFLGRPKLQEKPSALRREHPALENMKCLNFFSILWIILTLLDPDLDTESASSDWTASGSNPNQDPKHWRMLYKNDCSLYKTYFFILIYMKSNL
jgi:hypothetical protein